MPGSGGADDAWEYDCEHHDSDARRCPTAARPSTPPHSGWAAYGQAWVRTPGRALYLILAFVLAMTAISVLAGLFWTGVGLLILVVGLPIVVLALFVARGFGMAERYLLWLTGLPEIAEPEWNRDASESTGFWSTLTRPLRNGHYWTYLLYGMVISPIVSTITFALTTVWLSVSLGGLTYWFWASFIPRGDGTGEWGQYVVGRGAVAVRRLVELGRRGRPVPDRRRRSSRSRCRG